MKLFKILKCIILILLSLFILLIIIWQIDINFFHPNFKNDNPFEKNGPYVEIPKDQQNCEAKGGIWKKVGISPIEECNLKTNDKDKLCNNSDECQGYCLTELTSEEMSKGMKGQAFRRKGECSEWVKVFGCRAYVKNGWARVVCRD